jgi:antitoxin component YwqK of YwqJK toxin-antitoxin module
MSSSDDSAKSIKYDTNIESDISVRNAGKLKLLECTGQTQITVGNATTRRTLSTNSHICGDMCSKLCIYTPEKSDIYYKIKAAHEEIIDGIVVQEDSGIFPDGTMYEKCFKEGIQIGDWLYYSKNGKILSSESYRKDVPIYNHAYYPNGKIACMMKYDHKTGVCIMYLFTPHGDKIKTDRDMISLDPSRGLFKLVRTWHSNGHLHTETPTYIAYNYLKPNINSNKGDTTWGVHREWYPNGQLKEESFISNCENNILFTRTWDKNSKCSCEWNCMGNNYTELGDGSYRFNGRIITYDE